MSVFIVSEEHLNYLINYASIHDVQTRYRDQWIKVNGNENIFMNVLARANEESYAVRYSEDVEAIELTWRPLMRKYDPVQVLKACSCFDYQACEMENYGDSEAAKLIKKIRHEAIRNLAGYEEAAWEITDQKAVA